MTAQTGRLRAAFSYALAVCEDLGVDPLEIHVGQTFGYFELQIQVATGDEVDRVAAALGVPADPKRNNQAGIVKQGQEPWTDGAAALPLARPGDLHEADRIQVVAFPRVGAGQ